jgi:hypothetical protein
MRELESESEVLCTNSTALLTTIYFSHTSHFKMLASFHCIYAVCTKPVTTSVLFPKLNYACEVKEVTQKIALVSDGGA